MPRPAPSSSHSAFACAIVLTQARSAAYIGCNGSMASGIPAGRGYLSSLPHPGAHQLPRAGDVFGGDPALGVLGQSADDENQAGSTQRERLVDRALVVVERGLA